MRLTFYQRMSIDVYFEFLLDCEIAVFLFVYDYAHTFAIKLTVCSILTPFTILVDVSFLDYHK